MLSRDRLDIVYGSRNVFIHVGGNSIRNKEKTFKWSEILLVKYKELLVKAREMGKLLFKRDVYVKLLIKRK